MPDSDAPDEEQAPTGVETQTIYDSALSVGHDRMARSGRLILVEALIGGLYISVGALGAMTALAALRPGIGEEGAWLVASFFYPIGFLFVVFGRSDLFTENFLTPVLDAWHRPGRFAILLRLFALTLAGNLTGALFMAIVWWLPAAALLSTPVEDEFARLAEEQIGRTGLHIFIAGAFAGMLVNFMSWLLLASRGHVAKIVMVFVPTYLVMALRLHHSIVGSFENLLGILAGGATWTGYLLHWLPLTILGNLVGGVVFVTVLHAGQAALDEERAAG